MIADGRIVSAAETEQGSRLPQLAMLAVILFVLLYLLPLGYLPLVNPDEPRYAEIPREMLASGDFISPRLNGLRYFEKPPLGYWANAGSMALFGENPFALRFPGALAAGLTALLVFLFGRRVGLDREIAFGAALIQLTFGEVYFVATFGVLDSLLTLFLTSGMIFAYFAFTTDRRRDGIVAGLSFGAAFMTKGFLAFAVPVMVFIPWALWCGRWRTLLTSGGLMVVAALLIALPWSIAIHLQEPDFWRYFFWVEHVDRFFSSNADHSSPAYSLLLQLPLLAAPWIFVLPAAVAGLRADLVRVMPRPAGRFLWLWMSLPFLFFSLSSGKLATYILPCFPPLALLIALGLSRYLAAGHTRLLRAGVWLILLLLVLALALLLVGDAGWLGKTPFAEGEAGKLWLLAAALVVGIAAGVGALHARQSLTNFSAPAFAVAPLWFAAHYVVPQGLIEGKALDTLLVDLDRQQLSESVLIAKASAAGALAWYSRRDDVYLVFSQGEMKYGLGYPDSVARYLGPLELRALLAQAMGKQPVLILCRKACEPELTAHFPGSAKRKSNPGFEIWSLPLP